MASRTQSSPTRARWGVEGFVHWHGHVARVHRDRGYLGQERTVEQVVDRTHQQDFGVVRLDPLLQLSCAGEPRKACADDQDPRLTPTAIG
jgi:hypothetical protein